MNDFNKSQQSTVESPCVRNCCLNEKDVCLGCFRHIDEIIGWQSFTLPQKVVILDECTKRKGGHINLLK
jgi:predicted Fe-S protein YdhL (DUF1289 family)